MSSCQWDHHYIQMEGLQTFSSEKELLRCLWMSSVLMHLFFRNVKLLGNPFCRTKVNPYHGQFMDPARDFFQEIILYALMDGQLILFL